MSVVFMVLSVVRQNPADDSRARANLSAVVGAANGMYRETGSFEAAQPAALEAKVSGIRVVEATTRSDQAGVVSMAEAGEGWYGAVRSATGRCYIVGSVAGDPQLLREVLPGNCTGDAARASLTPPPAPPPGPSISRGTAGRGAPPSGSSPASQTG